jgi:hypothetical protein
VRIKYYIDISVAWLTARPRNTHETFATSAGNIAALLR